MKALENEDAINIYLNQSTYLIYTKERDNHLSPQTTSSQVKSQPTIKQPIDFNINEHNDKYSLMGSNDFKDRIDKQFELMEKLLPRYNDKYKNLEFSDKTVEMIKSLEEKIYTHFGILKGNFDKLYTIKDEEKLHDHNESEIRIKEKLNKINLLMESLAHSRKVMENTTMVHF